MHDPPKPRLITGKDGKSDAKSSDAKKSSSQTNPAKSVFRLTAFAQDAEKKDGKADLGTEAKPAKPLKVVSDAGDAASAGGEKIVSLDTFRKKK